MALKLIISLADDSNTDKLIEAARHAGATGATVITNARGEGRSPIRTFFGLDPALKRDVLLLLAPDTHAAAILETIRDVGEFDGRPGAGIALQIDVEQAVGLTMQTPGLGGTGASGRPNPSRSSTVQDPSVDTSNESSQTGIKAPSKKVSQKWGFGMAPPKPETRKDREKYCNALLKILSHPDTSFCVPEDLDATLDAISEVKGLFNRVVREDQWDWFTVWTQLGFPSRAMSRSIACALKTLRSSIKDDNQVVFTAVRDRIRSSPIQKYMSVFLGHAQLEREPDTGWIYILSTRESRGELKIGMTTRSVEERVNEINRATGIAVPFGVRKCWYVRNPDRIEKSIHEQLEKYRIRDDREFFSVDFRHAVKEINSSVANSEIEVLDALVKTAPDSGNAMQE